MAPNPLPTDALIIGAGPVGLFQAFQLGLLGIQADVVEALPYAGGQCATLYADKPIYDIPGLAQCTGDELTERLLTQLRPFAPGFHWGQHLCHLHPGPQGCFDLSTHQGQAFRARTVFIAAGVGAFLPRRLPLPGLQAFVGVQIFEGGSAQEIWQPGVQGSAVVLGQDDQAFDSALMASDRGYTVTLIHRREQFTATLPRQQALAQARAKGRVQFMAGQVVGWSAHSGQLTQLQVTTPTGVTQSLFVDKVHVCLGLVPQLGAIPPWGLALEGQQIRVNPATFETSMPGIFAVGDINSYPGKKKLILCGFHEATLAAHHAVTLLHPGATAQPLQYTTSSRELHRRLKV